MKKWLRSWQAELGSAYPSAFSPYWRALPIGLLTKLLMGIFFITAGVSFAVDILQLDHPPLWHGFFWPIFGGTMAAGVFAARIKKSRLVLPVWLSMVGLGALAFRAAHISRALPLPDGLYQRVAIDAAGIWLGAGLGYRLLLSFLTSQGLNSVRMQTELSLAHSIQTTLVPAIAFRDANFEVYGKSIPSAEMGGDLMDLIESEGGLLAYVGDVSGHGLAAGQLMGMLKTAIRVAVQFRQNLVDLLEGADRVLPVVKEPDMFATLALLRFDLSAEAEYASAGHVPILHYRHRSRDTARLSMPQFPLGLFPGGSYASQRVTCSSRDLFLILTDGILEVYNEKEEEFGLNRVEELLMQRGEQPLPHIYELIMEKVRQHGVQEDDQTVLLVRVLRPCCDSNRPVCRSVQDVPLGDA
jgi:serine phosphatase RsbU (regulator of sigma subunit)